MCTAISFRGRYFGRTLDHEKSFGEQIVITPPRFTLNFRKGKTLERHYSILGVATVEDQYPLYFDAINEKGLGMAGLNFAGNARYFEPVAAKINLSPFEFIPWILSGCCTVSEAKKALVDINLVNIPFSSDLALSPLHWMIADQTESIVVESVNDGLKVYDNPIGVLTNNPPFHEQLFNLNNYMHLSPAQPENKFLSEFKLEKYSRGMGGLGLPGDLSSMSRFVRATFVKNNSVCNEQNELNQFFHILGSVSQVKGCVEVSKDEYEITKYTSCGDLKDGIYYYSTYDNSRITAVKLKYDDEYNLLCYPFNNNMSVVYEN